MGAVVATWLCRPGGRDLERKSRPGLGLGRGKRSRDPVLRSRPGLALLRSLPGLEVATWPRMLGHLVSRPGLWVATWGKHMQARPACSRTVHSTWVLGVHTVHLTQF